MIVLLIGPAGSGKTTLTAVFGNYLEEIGYDVRRINLDPAVEELPYSPDFDIRKLVTLSEVMKKHKIGPNLAFVKSIEEIWEKRETIRNFLGNERFDICLLDMPGQLELVLFHSIRITDIFKSMRTLALFLIPADILKTGDDLIFLRFLFLACKFRTGIETLYAISKCDMYSCDEGNVTTELSEVLKGVLEYLRDTQRVVKVSCVTKEGFDELLDLLHEAFCSCGDLS